MDEESEIPEELRARQPSVEDLLELCRELNSREAKYIVVGGFAMRASGFVRETMDVDLLVSVLEDNEQRVFKALEILPDKAILEATPGMVADYTVLRVGDDIVVDLMKSACGITFEHAIEHVQIHEIQGVPIPFASPRLLWRMKSKTHREKDIPDLIFLREWFAARGEQPPE